MGLLELTNEEKDKVKSLQEMIESCYTYGGADIDSYNFDRYIKPHKEKMGEMLFNLTYVNHLKYLKENFKINKNVTTDFDGLTYNSLSKI